MKKLIAVLLALALLAGLAACGSTSPEAPGTTNAGENATQNETPADSKEPAPQSDTPDTEPAPDTELEITCKEWVLVDTDECAMRITDIVKDESGAYYLTTELENKTEDKNLRFDVFPASVNYLSYTMMLSLFERDVPVGQTVEDVISFEDGALNAELGDFTDIGMSVRVFDADDMWAGTIFEQEVHVYPCGQDNMRPYIRETQPTDVVLVDNDDFTVVVTGYEVDEAYSGFLVNLYIENRTDVPVTISADGAFLNDTWCDDYMPFNVYPGRCAFSCFEWLEEDLEPAGINDIEKIEFNLAITNEEDWEAEPLFSDTFTLFPDPPVHVGNAYG